MKKKLTLSKETIRKLTTDELGEVAGGRSGDDSRQLSDPFQLKPPPPTTGCPTSVPSNPCGTFTDHHCI